MPEAAQAATARNCLSPGDILRSLVAVELPHPLLVLQHVCDFLRMSGRLWRSGIISLLLLFHGGGKKHLNLYSAAEE